MRKVYARQIPPEHQESPLFLGDEFWPEDVILDGNRDFRSHTIPEYDQIIRYFDEMAAEWENDSCWYEYTDHGCVKRTKKHDYTLAEILRDYGFSRRDGKLWSNKQKHEWRLLMEGEKPGDDNAVICAALELITGKAWRCATIRGCCQSDWQELIYPTENGREWLEQFETEYFNTGSEWMIHDEETDPETPEEISGFCMYCHGWNDEQIRAEIANEAGGLPADVVLYGFDGWTQSARYAAW